MPLACAGLRMCSYHMALLPKKSRNRCVWQNHSSRLKRRIEEGGWVVSIHKTVVKKALVYAWESFSDGCVRIKALKNECRTVCVWDTPLIQKDVFTFVLNFLVFSSLELITLIMNTIFWLRCDRIIRQNMNILLELLRIDKTLFWQQKCYKPGSMTGFSDPFTVFEKPQLSLEWLQVVSCVFQLNAWSL